jgi:hypothetical protein
MEHATPPEGVRDLDPLPPMVHQPSRFAVKGRVVSRYDHIAQIIRIDGYGDFQPDQIDDFAQEFGRLIADMRQRLGRVRVVVDRRNCPPVSDATRAKMRHHSVQNAMPGDRVAILVDSSLAKHLLKGSLDERTHMLFVSERAALTWLTAHD